MRSRARIFVVLALFFAAVCAWCARGRERSADVVAEPTPSVPSDVVFYAHVLYGGDSAYLIDGRWFRPGATGWLVFTKEPLELALVRESVESGRHASTLFDP